MTPWAGRSVEGTRGRSPAGASRTWLAVRVLGLIGSDVVASIMSSQRDREQRIVDRLHTGALPLAGPSDTAHPNPRVTGRCYGCTEPEADVEVRDQPWHAICAIFWQGRSATLRDQRIPHTQPGAGFTPARPRWVIVVPVDRPDTYKALRRSFARSPWVDVVVDRRRGDRRQDGAAPQTVERRMAGRRTVEREPAEGPAFRLAHRGPGSEVYESTSPESLNCPDCGALVSVELPRFVEPPVRLELVVLHEPVPAERTARHVVELQSFSPTGRELLATRLAGRTRPPPTP